MKCGEIIHGFKIESERELADFGARLFIGRHIKSGATLIFIDREDTNKTFSITFKTVPTDSTGVFHILEHSVLCGSRKFPVKEPFVDLLKSSLNTFLNAFTFPDKTMYPVSSRCDKDFLNLIDVYMDAVLHPMALEKPEIFYQEGWHYELHEGESELSYKGVVLNEMKGAYSSVEDLEGEYLTRLTYRGTPYEYDSGGDPDKIVTLAYEDFCQAHAKFYHPSNSTVFLDGSVDLDATLALIDGYLSEYEAQAPIAEIPSPALVGEQSLVAEYEIAEGESEQGRERVSLSFPTFSYSEKKKHSAVMLALEAIAGTNEAPLKKAILDAGLCDSVQIYPYDGVKDNSVSVTFRNVRSEDRERVSELFLTKLAQILDEGLDRDKLAAEIGRFKFKTRDVSGGGYPLGIALSIAAMEAVLYGGDAYDALSLCEVGSYLDGLYNAEGGFEKLLREVFLSPRYFARLTLTPSSTLGQRRDEQTRQALGAVYDAMSDSQRREIIARTARIEDWQRSEDSDEARATLPKLTLDDVPKDAELLPTTVYNISGNTILHTDFPSRGITHLHLLFDVSELSGDELFRLALLLDLLENVDTEHHSASDLQTLVKAKLGRFSSSAVILSKAGEPKAYARISASMLDESKAPSAELISEIILKSKFDGYDSVSKFIRQAYVDTRDAMSASGHTVALSRASSYVSAEGAVGEYVDGIEYYKLIKELDRSYNSRKERLADELSALAARVFTRERLLISYVGERDDLYIGGLISAFPSSGISAVGRSPISPFGNLNEGIQVPAQVSFASKVGMALKGGETLHGAYAVVRNILSYGYLWNEIRVQGGAYGAGFIQRMGGTVGFYTYRDPSAARSIEKFTHASDYLREIATSGEPLDEYIIGAISEYDPLYTALSAGTFAFTRYLRGESDESIRERRRQILSCTQDELRIIAQRIDEVMADGGVCVVGGKETLARCGDSLKSIVEIV